MTTFKLEQTSVDEIRELLVGRTVKIAADGELHLDNGVKVQVHPNSGCWGCISGNYHVEKLNDVENVITDVKVSEKTTNPEDHYSDDDCKVYSIFVYTGKKKRKKTLLSVAGSDGNGYYGTGYTLHVSI